MKSWFLAATILLLLLQPGFCQDKGQPDRSNATLPNKITVSTELAKYSQTEVIKVSLFNGLKRSVFSHAGGPASLFSINKIERKNQSGTWDKLTAQCQYPNCVFDLDAPVEIKPGTTAMFGWKPLEYPEGKEEAVLLKPGVYRLLMNYQFRPGKTTENWNWITTYSNEFTITGGGNNPPAKTGNNY